MGYDLFIKRNVFVDKSKLSNLSELKSESDTIVLSETITSLRGWDIGMSVVPIYGWRYTGTTTEEVLDLYLECCELQEEPTNEKFINLLNEDLENDNVFYTLYQSY